MSAIELVVIERAGLRLALPAARVAMVGELPGSTREARLQAYFGQPPPAEGERCMALAVRAAGGGAELVPVVGRVSITQVDPEAIAALPPLLAGTGPVVAVVFQDEALLVLDADAVIARRRAGR